MFTATSPDQMPDQDTILSMSGLEFMLAMKAGEVIKVVSEVVNRSRRLGVIESRFENMQTGKLCAIVTGTWMPTKRDFSR